MESFIKTHANEHALDLLVGVIYPTVVFITAFWCYLSSGPLGSIMQ